MTTTYSGEKYRCSQCDKDLLYQDIFRTWTCPNCSKPVEIKLDSNITTFVRLKPKEIKEGSYVSLDGTNIYEVGDRQIRGNDYSVWLKQYTRTVLKSKDFYFVVKGT